MTSQDTKSSDLRDRIRVSLLMALLVVMAGVAFVVTSVAYSYGENGGAPSTSVSPAVIGLLFVLHITGYLASPWLARTRASTATYLALQAILAFGVSRSIDGPVPTVFLWLAWAEQTISYYPRRWPLVVAVATSLAIVDLAGDAVLGRQTLAIVVTFAALFTAIYAVSFVRGVLVRREARDLLLSLRESQDELNHYASEIEERTLVAERRRLARELHDTLAQGLVGVTLQLEAADAQLDGGSAGRAQEILRQAMSRARETLTSARRAIDDLRIQDVDGDDLGGRLRAEVGRFSAATGIRSDVELKDVSAVTGADAEQILRIVTEGLTNIARHAAARSVRLIGSRTNANVHLELRDDGCGFDPDAAPHEGHYGLLGIHERARSIGGAVRVVSAPGRGTSIHLELRGHAHDG